MFCSSFKCQIAHWRQGHKDECHPPSVNTRHDDEEEKAEVGRAAKENVSVGVKQVAEMNKPDVGSETSDANHDLKSSNGKSKHMPSKAVCSSVEIPGGHKSNNTVEISQNVQSVDSSKMGSSIKHANFVEDGSSTEDLNEALPCNSHSSSLNINGHSSFVNKEFCNHSKEYQRAKDATVVEDCSQTNSTR
jgi:ubiquitin carboxyl-terminal hydrolase 36/42